MTELKCSHSLAFKDGCLNIKTSGYGDANFTGEFVFYDEDVDYEVSEENGKTMLIAKVFRSELLEIRDFITRVIAERPPHDDANG